MERIQVDGYDILLGDVKDALTNVLSAFSKSSFFILTDENTYRHCWPIIREQFDSLPHTVFKISSGEINKTLQSCIQVWWAMTEAQLDRHSVMINLGGGVITDLGGFCASTYKRGIPFVQVPTTLLSQVDASIGGKLGIDFESYKNHIGVFRFPHTVIIDPAFLNTLSDRELRSGYAEVIKHCLIADESYWTILKSIINLREQDWESIIRRSLEVKRKIVIQDPYEKGMRKLLNFGHTIGHAIESHYLQSSHPLLHGEAIASGMIYETQLSKKYAGLPDVQANDIIAYIQNIYGFPVEMHVEQTLPIMLQDKKNSSNRISFSLLQNIGTSTWDYLLTANEMFELEKESKLLLK